MNLAVLLDQIPSPQFPEHFSEQDRQFVLLALASAKQQIRPYNGYFQAPWLLNSFESTVWETTNRGREEFIDGKWRNVIRIDWRIALPNGAVLTDERYERLLSLAKKIAFFVRCNLISGSSAPGGWATNISVLTRLLRWIVLHEHKFQPEKYGLRLLDQPSVDWLFCLVAEGGWMHALQVPQRLLAAIYKGAHGVACPQVIMNAPYAIPLEEMGPLVRWLEGQEAYRAVREGAHHGKRQLRREVVSKLISENYLSFKSSSISRFLRQFEPDFRDEHLLVGLRQSTEFPSQGVVSILDIGGGAGASSGDTLKAVSALLGTVLDAHRHVPDLLPEPACISLRAAARIGARAAKPSSHTLFMPVNTGLAYLNQSMRFVHVYGEAIVDFYLAVLADYSPAKGCSRMNSVLKKYSGDWRIASGVPIATVLNITEFRRWEPEPDFIRLRSNPTLDEALRVLIGSCIICMALLKPSREEELTHLKRNCMREDSGGYWINFDLGKSNSGNAWQDEERPIPVISAKAIYLLQRLGGGLSLLFAEDRKIGDNLFYLPKAEGFSARAATVNLLNNHLDIFCDYVGLPPDSEGRRWYVRIHEMRKWFLLLLFWSGRFDVLDAARWIAGHTDAAHIYAYIEKEFPGEELPQMEAEYSIDRIYRREQERKRGQHSEGNGDGVDALYEAVLRHFNAESLAMVPESEWASYVSSLRKEDKFRLEPHSIFGENGQDVIGINVSFIMREII